MGRRDIRANGKLLLCACELDYHLEDLEGFGDPNDLGESDRLEREITIRELIDAAIGIRDQIAKINEEGRG